MRKRQEVVLKLREASKALLKYNERISQKLNGFIRMAKRKAEFDKEIEASRARRLKNRNG